MKIPAIVVVVVATCLASGEAFAQTTRTSPSASSTFRSIQSSSPTSANSPCSPSNPTSPCYSANAPRDPCYSAVSPNEPCSTTTTPSSQSLPAASAKVSPPKQERVGSAVTIDQAKARIEEAGYSDLSDLRKDLKGVWRAKAVKDGLTVNVTLEANGKVSAE